MNEEMICIECFQPLLSIPIFNNGEEMFPPSFLFCPNRECRRHGLLTITFKRPVDLDEVKDENKSGNEENQHKVVQP